MKKITCFITVLAFNLLLTLPSFAIELPKEGLKGEECKVPGSYAKVVKVKDGEEEEEQIIFSNRATAYSPHQLNNILCSYGVVVSLETLKDKESKVPGSYAKVVKVKDGEEEEEQIVFSNTVTAYSPNNLNSIFSAYGVDLSLDALKDKGSKVPGSYAKVVKVKDGEEEEEQIVFSNRATAYSPNNLNNILNAYK